MAKVEIDTRKIYEAERKAKAHALWRMGQAVIARAQRDKLVPIDTGTLRRSAVVTFGHPPDPGAVYETAKGTKAKSDSPNNAGNVDKAYVSYNTPYAERLHENLDWKPAPPIAEGGPKWMEMALAACKSKFPAILARTFREHFS